MPHVIEKTAYRFDELDDSAKERARDWWRQGESYDSDDLLDREDFETIAAILGIEFKQRAVPLMNGKTRYESTIYYSGFSSQGDGACFEGSYAYAKAAPKRIRDYARNDTRLHKIADELQAIQRKAFYSLTATVEHSGHYYHEYCTRIDVEDSRGFDMPEIDNLSDAIAECLRDFMRWIYRQLEQEYEYRMSDENVDESIRINGYDFDESGRHLCI
jgi:hypothetical protein